MPRITPVRWQILECVFKLAGFTYDGERGDHVRYTKRGVVRPIIIPKYKSIGVHIIRSNLRTAGLDRGLYFQLLNQCT